MAVQNTPRQPVPLVSVIIPMYNAARYIGECLDSLLAQTFQNFEVIVVNDCSTDNSIAIVENYALKFNGRLKLSHMEKNICSPSAPRNKGIVLSRGEYVFLADADDKFTPTAFDKLYALAKNHDADVVLMEKNYQIKSDGTNLKIIFTKTGKLVEKPTFETEDLTERTNELMRFRYRFEPWLKLVRRDLIIENKIFFPNTRHGDDTIWTLALVFHAKRLLRVPNVVYIYRLSENSIMRSKKTPQQEVTFRFNPILLGLTSLNQMLSRLEFFKKNPKYLYAIFENFIRVESSIILNKTFQFQPFEIYEMIKQEFGEKLGEHDVLVAALCTIINTQQKINAVNAQKFQQFAAQAQARIAQLETQLKTK